MSAEPRVSVCIPAYNHAEFIGEAIESVLAQTYRSFELVVADDGSTDGTYEVALAYAERHPDMITVHRHDGGAHRGISATGNLAIERSRGELWAPLPSDDRWYPGKLSQQVAWLDAHPEIAFVHASMDLVADGRKLRGSIGADPSIAGDALDGLLESNTIVGPTVCARLDIVRAAGLHDVDLVYQDWELWARLLAHDDAAYRRDRVGAYRVHSANTSMGIDREVASERAAAVMQRLLDRAHEVGGRLSRPRTLALLELQHAFFSFCAGDAASLEGRLERAASADPTLRSDRAFVDGWLRRKVCDRTHHPSDDRRLADATAAVLGVDPSPALAARAALDELSGNGSAWSVVARTPGLVRVPQVRSALRARLRRFLRRGR